MRVFISVISLLLVIASIVAGHYGLVNAMPVMGFSGLIGLHVFLPICMWYTLPRPKKEV